MDSESEIRFFEFVIYLTPGLPLTARQALSCELCSAEAMRKRSRRGELVPRYFKVPRLFRYRIAYAEASV